MALEGLSLSPCQPGCCLPSVGPCLPHRLVDGISPVSVRECGPLSVLPLRAKRPALHGTLARSRLGAQAGPPPCTPAPAPALTLPTKPEVNLDCVLAAARGRACVAERPQKISTTRL
jgi:hypothetical protein